jgi:hypothetical protein
MPPSATPAGVPATPVTAAPVAPPSTGSSFVTLQPAGASGRMASDANDGADFWGLGVALVAIVLVIVVAQRFLGPRGSPHRQSRGER